MSSDPTPPATRTPRSAKSLAVITVLASLIVGFILGVVGDRIWMFHHGPFGGRHGSRFTTERMVNRLDRELKFSTEQRQAVTRIVEARHQRIDAIFRGFQPQIRGEIDATNAEIEKLLTAEQKAKFEAMKMRVRSRPHTPGE